MVWLSPQAVQRGENCRDERLLVARVKQSGAECGAHAKRKLKKPSCVRKFCVSNPAVCLLHRTIHMHADGVSQECWNRMTFTQC